MSEGSCIYCIVIYCIVQAKVSSLTIKLDIARNLQRELSGKILRNTYYFTIEWFELKNVIKENKFLRLDCAVLAVCWLRMLIKISDLLLSLYYTITLERPGESNGPP